METSTHIRNMFKGNKIIVPNYQRAYSWDVSTSEQSPKQVNVFLSDLEEHLKSKTKSKYYFGHFLFEEEENNNETFYVVDGQQRMTTIVIFVSVLLRLLQENNICGDNEEDIKEDLIIRRSTYRFETVYYDKQSFIDMVIDHKKIADEYLETESARRISNAYQFFSKKLAVKNIDELQDLLNLVINASCTTHSVKDESEAIQMFLFQNNRGKKPSDLEVIKAQFMFYLHLYGGDNKERLIETVKNRFEIIYRSISSIEHKINEDDVLRYVLRVYFNSLWESNSLERINKKLEDSSKILSDEDNCIQFICGFSDMLADSFKYLSSFYQDESNSLAIHSLIVIGGKIGIAMPFILKAYLYQIPFEQKEQLCIALGDILLRDRLIRTRAEMESRINGVYSKFLEENKDISPILERIEYLKNIEQGWESYWNYDELKKGLEKLNASYHSKLICLLLWKYENYLQGKGKKGYTDFLRFDKVIKPEVEHIAPQTESEDKKASGYGNYTKTFYEEGMDSLGNYLLVSKSHNCSIGNLPFSEKLKSYKKLNQHREIQDFLDESKKWDLKAIKRREETLFDFFLKNI